LALTVPHGHTFSGYTTLGYVEIGLASRRTMSKLCYCHIFTIKHAPGISKKKLAEAAAYGKLAFDGYVLI
jgi:hypothetical protein